MAIITVPSANSGRNYTVKIAGDTPTMDEQLRIDSFLRQRDMDFAQEYEATVGEAPEWSQTGLFSPMGEILPGLARGAVGMLETGALGAAAALPEEWEDPTREFIRKRAYSVTPQRGYGMDDSLVGDLSEAVGSVGGLIGASVVGGPWTALGLAGAAGAGEASERARMSDASEEDRSKATLFGVAPGMLDFIPVNRLIGRFGRPAVAGWKGRLARVLQQGGEEAVQEAAQGIFQNEIARQIYDPETGTFEGVAEDAGLGAGAGAIVQGLVELVLPGRRREAMRPKHERSEEDADAPLPEDATPEQIAAGLDAMMGDEAAAAPPDASLLPIEPISRPVVAEGTPEFDALTQGRQAQERAQAQAAELGVEQKILRDAAEGLTVEQGAQRLGRVINPISRSKDVQERANLRNEFVRQVRARAGIPADPASPEFLAWKAAFEAADAAPAAPPMAPLADPNAELAAAEAAATAATERAPERASAVTESGKVEGTPATEATLQTAEEPSVRELAEDIEAVEAAVAQEADAGPTFTPEFVTDVLGFSSRSKVAARDALLPELAGKPISDPAVQEYLNKLRTRGGVMAPRRAAIDAVLAESATAPEPVTTPEEAPAPMEAEAVPEVEAAPEPTTPKGERASAVTESGKVEPSEHQQRLDAVADRIAAVDERLDGLDPTAPETRVLTNMRNELADEHNVLADAADTLAETQTAPVVEAETPAQTGAAPEPTPAAAPAAPRGRRVAAPSTPEQIRRAQQDLADRRNTLDPVENRELREQLAQEVEAGMSEDVREFLGEASEEVQDVTSPADKRQVISLLRRGGTPTPEAKAAKKFFSMFPNASEAILEIASQSVLAPKRFMKSSDTDAAMKVYAGMGGDAARSAGKWVYQNLSADARTLLKNSRRDAQQTSQRLHARGERGRDPVAMSRKHVDAEAAQFDNISETVAEDIRQRQIEQDREALGQDLDANLTPAERQARQATAVPDRFRAPEAPTRRAPTQKKSEFRTWVDEIYSPAEQQAMSKAEIGELYDSWAYSKMQGFSLETDAVASLDTPLLPSTRRLLIQGDLVRALESIAATSESSGVSRIARGLAKVVGNTKVELMHGVTDEGGAPVAGLFDPQTNTIYIDASDGINTHTILHEMTHAAVSATIAKPAHPLTKQLRALFDKVSPELGATYGARNLQEFSAELMSNPEFQGQLAQLTERGKKITALDRAFHAVRNFVRRLAGQSWRPMNSALTRGDQIINGMMAPSPDTRNAGALYMAHRKGFDDEVMTNVINAGVDPNPSRIDRLGDILTDASKDSFLGGRKLGREILLRLTPLHYLVQVAERTGFPGASALNSLVNQMSSETARKRDAVNAFKDDFGKWAHKHPDLVDTFNTMTNNATMRQVDPELNATQAAKKYGLDTDRMRQWRIVKAEWNSLGKDGQTEYRRMRNVFRTIREDLIDALKGRLEVAIPDKVARASVLDRLTKDLAEKGSLEPYTPLRREGNLWLTYNAFDPRSGRMEFFAETFTRESARDRAQQELEADPSVRASNFHASTGKEHISYNSAPEASFMAQLRSKMLEGGADADTVAMVTDMYLDVVPETSFLHSFRDRKGVLGANKDAMRSATDAANSMTRSIVQLKYGSELSKLQSQFDEQLAELGRDGRVSPEIEQMHAQLTQFAKFARSPTRSRWSRNLSYVAFNATLGFNVSTSFLNLAQVPLIGVPYLAGKYGMRNSIRAYGAATRIMAMGGGTREIEVFNPNGPGMIKRRVKAMPSVENIDFSNPDLTPRERLVEILVEEGRENGQFHRSVTHDILDVDGKRNWGEKINAGSGWMLHHAERYNRETSMLAAFNLKLDQIAQQTGREPTRAEAREAALEAVYATEMINGGTAAAAAPRISHSDIGNLAFMFQRYVVSMYSTFFDVARSSLKAQSPEGKAIARKQLAYMTGSVAMMSGVSGLPMYGMLTALWNLFMTGDDDRDANTIMRDALSEPMYRGVLNSVTGINFATRISLGDVLFRESTMHKEQAFMWDALEKFGGPVVGTALNIDRGVNYFKEGEIARGLEAALPASMRYILRAHRFSTEGARNRHGDAIVEDLSNIQLLGQLVGFAPTEYAAQQDINAARKRFEIAVVKQRSKLLDRLAVARRNGMDVRDIWDDIRAYNAKYPEKAITPTSVRQSAAARDRRQSNTYSGVSFDKRLAPRILEHAKDYNG